jgi:hypothetical protein
MNREERIERLEAAVGAIARILSRLSWGEPTNHKVLTDIANTLAPKSGTAEEQHGNS